MRPKYTIPAIHGFTACGRCEGRVVDRTSGRKRLFSSPQYTDAEITTHVIDLVVASRYYHHAQGKLAEKGRGIAQGSTTADTCYFNSRYIDENCLEYSLDKAIGTRKGLHGSDSGCSSIIYIILVGKRGLGVDAYATTRRPLCCHWWNRSEYGHCGTIDSIHPSFTSRILSSIRSLQLQHFVPKRPLSLRVPARPQP